MKTQTRKSVFTTILLVLSCVALCPLARAVVPPPDGGYPVENTAEGEDALFSLTTGVANTAIGFDALYSNTTGDANTAIGDMALRHSTGGNFNTATGWGALFGITTGSNNTAMGFSAGGSRTGTYNTAIGADALEVNEAGNNNTAVGGRALLGSQGSNNTAMGFQALQGDPNAVTTGINNTATGAWALVSNTTGDNNTAMGFQALYSNTTGIDNTATGLNALFSNTEGNENTATGHSALQNNITGTDNTAVGHDALFNNTTGSNNIALGHGAGSNLTTGSNNIDIGFFGVADEANTIRIGTQGTQTKTFIAGINGAGVTGMPVKVDANGQLGTTPSSVRFKQNIKAMDKASEAILALKPVTFHYKKELDPEDTPQFGLVAEDVEKVNPNLVVHDKDGKPYSVRYDQVNAMLLNEFLKEHRKVEQLTKKFEAKFVEQQKQIETLTAGLQKMSAQVELSKPAPQMVLKHQ
jgi:trimeric autotransporter adhesin